MFDSDNYCFALIIVNVNEAPRSKSLSTLIQINRRKHDYYVATEINFKLQNLSHVMRWLGIELISFVTCCTSIEI